MDEKVVSEAQISTLFNHLDMNKDNLVSLDEFLKWFQKNSQLAKKNKPTFWRQLMEKLPVAKTEEDRKERKRMFIGMDVNNNGMLSLAEVDLGIKNILNCEELFKCKPVLIRAFNAVKNQSGEQTGLKSDLVELSEFRGLLWYLRQYFKYWELFSSIDTSHDRRISYKEFAQCLSLLTDWGVDTSDPQHTFRQIDADGKGMVLFDELCNWALRQHLDLEPDPEDITAEVELKVQAREVKLSRK